MPLKSSAYALALSERRWLRYFAFFYLYVMQGIPAGFGLYTLANYLTAHQISPAAVGVFAATVGLPWSFQFIWGPIIDKYQQSSMGRRRPWVLLAQTLALLASLGLLVVDDPIRELSSLQLAFFVHSVFASVQDASVDALAISVIPENERGRLTAVMRGGFLGGISLGSAGLAVVLHAYGFHAAVWTQSLVLLSLTVLTFFIKERPEQALFSLKQIPFVQASLPSARGLFRELFRGLTEKRSLRLFIPILLYYGCQAVFSRAYSVHLIQRLGWSDADVSVLQGTLGTLVVIAVVLLGGIIADRMGAQRLMGRVMLGAGLFLLTFNLLHIYWHELAVGRMGLVALSMMDPSFSVASMPVLMALCRKSVEGSQFTAYMAMVNLTDITGAYVSGQAQMSIPAPVLGAVCGIIILVAALLVWFPYPWTRWQTKIASPKTGNEV
ncbi:MFS transporter [Siphonobacter sp. BAB-5385]|uniref:MFS transporter n=1 Tax=Siphonobacter sp. BAB-5385 TaxID=1864822 RepID=UPI000B9DE996|nr:MFS transporter [Siphonobacter sp. BAB-5385]OZI05991.1 MFS transporter [Siphonobacter sp. BAB-5385]